MFCDRDRQTYISMKRRIKKQEGRPERAARQPRYLAVCCKLRDYSEPNYPFRDHHG